MGIIEGNIISAPLNTRDVGSVLGSASNDVGTLCTHANINMWAKFKPVPLRAVYPEDTLKGSSDWNGNPQSGTHRPWWYGDGDAKTYTVPVISELADIGSNGNQNSGGVWKYNRPTGKGASDIYPDFPYRLTDFIGYRHDARPPFTASLPVALTADMYMHVGVDMLERETGELDLSDIKDILHVRSLYIAIAIRNITKNITTAYVSMRQLDANDSDSWYLPLQINSSLPISSGGAGQVISNTDTVDIYVFLSTSAGETNIDAMTKYSAMLDAKSVVYKRYNGFGDNINILKGTYTYSISVDSIVDKGKTYYYRDSEGSIYAFRKTIDQITNPESKVRVKLTSGSTAYESLRATIVQKGKVTDSDTGQLTEINLVYALAYNEGAGLIDTSNKTIILGDTFNYNTFAAYSTEEDAYSESNIQWMRGMPIVQNIVYNNADGNLEGAISDNKLDVIVMISPSSHYTRVELANNGTPVSVEQ